MASRRRRPRSPVLVSTVGESELIRHGLSDLLRPFGGRVLLLDPESEGTRAEVVLFDCCPHPEPGRSRPRRPPDGTPGVTVAYSWRSSPDLVAWTLDHGYAGYLSKALPVNDLVTALEAVREGRIVVRAGANGARAPEPPRRLVADGGHGLTPRECEVLSLVCSGLRNTEIADRMQLSLNTVKSYIRSAYRRIGATSRSQAVLWGIEHGVGRSHP